MRRAVILRNPCAAGAARAIDGALNALRASGIEVQIHEPESAEHMRFLIRAEARSVDAVIVGGGDGTINAALKPVLEAGLPLGVLPMGTANDLARTLGIPSDLHEAGALIASRRTRDIDVGWANHRPFVNAAGIGLSTRIARSLSVAQKRSFGPLSYLAGILEALRRRRPFRAVIRSDADRLEVSSIQITIGNGVYYGGGTPITEHSAIDDGCLDLYSVRPQTVWGLIAAALALHRGSQHRGNSGVDTARGGAFLIATRPVLTVSLDGEPAIETPVSFRLGRGALTVFAPEPATAPSAAGRTSRRLGTGPADAAGR